jgi:hypothetical protein
MPRRAWIAAGIAALLAGGAVRAQDASDLVNFAFASRLGSGIYDIDGRTIQIYRIPVGFRPIRLENGRKFGLEVRLPVTIGLFDFQPGDVLEEGLPDQFDSFGFTPGVLFDVPVTPKWTAYPFVEAGPVYEGQTDSTSWVYTLGCTSETKFRSGPGEVTIRNELAWSGMGSGGDAVADTFGELINGFEIWRPLVTRVAGHQLVVGAFGANYFYWSRAEFVGSEEVQPGLLRAQWEMGAMLSTRPRAALWKIPLPDLGLSYRWGDDLSTVRFVLGRTF